MKSFYNKIYNIIKSGGKLIIINRKGIQLDISLDFTAIIDKKNKEIEDFNKEKIVQELIALKNEILKLKEIKNIRDNYIIKKKLYEDSDEAKLVKRLMNKNIKDINAAIKNYDENSTELIIEKEYESQINTIIKEQISEKYNEIKLDTITEYYKKKFK